jgi:hypothetical protein
MMPRYFFHVHLNETAERDLVGLELTDLLEAVVSAQRAISAIMVEDDTGQLWLEIADENGNVLARID